MLKSGPLLYTNKRPLAGTRLNPHILSSAAYEAMRVVAPPDDTKKTELTLLW